MRIKIAQENAGNIEESLLFINKTAKKHTFTTYAEVEKQAKDAEDLLSKLGIPKMFRLGAKYVSCSGGPAMAKSYMYQRTVSVLHLERGGKDWFLCDVKSTTLWPNQGEVARLCLRPEQDALAVKNTREKYLICDPS